MDARAILHILAPEVTPELRADGFWATMPGLDVRAMADHMLASGARLITLTAMLDSAEGVRVMYHWDIDGDVVTVSTTATGGKIPTISDILPGADWVEREIRDYYALEFEGRAETPTLMLREGDEPGLFSRTCMVGKECDPAETARAAVAAKPEGV